MGTLRGDKVAFPLPVERLPLRVNSPIMSAAPNPAHLLLADGTHFTGKPFGAATTAVGELCFNTSMAGYQEVFSDPSYFGQILVMTHTHLGTYGVHPEEMESARAQIRAMVCRNFSQVYSRESASGALNDWLSEAGVPGISRLDTRALVRHLRGHGAMNAIVSTDGTPLEALREQLAAHPSMDGLELASQVTTEKPYTLGEGTHHVAVFDYGTKQNILRSLLARSLKLTVFPAETPFAEVGAQAFDGYVLSNGPGDPAAMPYAVEQAKAATASGKPVFGICMGHQILGQALGMSTYKMPFGHRGSNHAVRNETTGLSEITSQNHGFGVRPAEKDAAVMVTHWNLNDQSVAGLRATGKPVFSVQYHPEANPGPHDGRYLFDEFVAAVQAS